MSRVAQSKTSPVSRRDYPRPTGEVPDEICPVCKTSRYIRPTMRLLLNPVCYHKMCESCVDRTFSNGPARCPIPKCNQTLRKNKFRQQTFEDIQVEREVDIRKRVATVFNRREEDFIGLREYNDYLNEVEDITYNLINNVDIEETRKKFEEYELQHEVEIKENASLAEQEKIAYNEMQRTEREQAKQRREAARREELEERREAEANRKDLLRRLENGQDPEKVAHEGQQVQLKKRLNRQAAEQRQQQLQAASENKQGGSGNMIIKGLKAKKATEPEKPVDPFGGLYFTRQYYSSQDHYVWDVLQSVKQEPLIGAGGYDLTSFTDRSLFEAFSGLGVMIADEATEREKMQQDDAVATVKAEVVAQDVQMDDPF